MIHNPWQHPESPCGHLFYLFQGLKHFEWIVTSSVYLCISLLFYYFISVHETPFILRHCTISQQLLYKFNHHRSLVEFLINSQFDFGVIVLPWVVCFFILTSEGLVWFLSVTSTGLPSCSDYRNSFFYSDETNLSLLLPTVPFLLPTSPSRSSTSRTI